MSSRAFMLALAAVLLVGALVLGFSRLALLGGGDAPSAWPVPNPDASAMEPRVQELLGQRQRAVVDAPASSQAWGELGIACDAHSLINEAVEAYGRAATLEPANFRWAYYMALGRIAQGADARESVELLESAARLKPDYAPLHIRLGELYAAAGQVTQARAAFTRVLELEPGSAVAHRSLGRLLLNAGQIDEAIRHLESAQRIVPNDRAVATALAQGYQRLGDESRASEWAAKSAGCAVRIGLIDPIREEVEDAGVSTRLLDERAQKLMSRGQFEQAANNLVLVAQRYPNDASVHVRLGTCCQQMKQTDRAIAHLLEALRLKEDLVDAHLRLAALWWERGDFDKAAHHYRAIIEHATPNADHHSFLAIALANAGDLEGAIDEFQKAIELAPQRADKHSDLGTALLRQGKPETAIERFAEALRIDPRYAVAHFNIATAYEQLGRIDQALEHYRQAYKLDPKSPAGAKLVELMPQK